VLQLFERVSHTQTHEPQNPGLFVEWQSCCSAKDAVQHQASVGVAEPSAGPWGENLRGQTWKGDRSDAGRLPPLTEFEQKVEELGLRPGEYQASPQLRSWCRMNANSRYVPEYLLNRYVPEYLLKVWGIKVNESWGSLAWIIHERK